MLMSILSRKVSRSQMTESGTISIPRRSRASPGKSAVLSVTTPILGTRELLHRDEVRVVWLTALGDLRLKVRMSLNDGVTQCGGPVQVSVRSPVDRNDLTRCRVRFRECPER